MQVSGVKRARSPDDDGGTCCGGARSAKSGRRTGNDAGGAGSGSGQGAGSRGQGGGDTGLGARVLVIRSGPPDPGSAATASGGVQIDRFKIRNTHGADKVKNWSRSNIILHVKGLPTHANYDTWETDALFTGPIMQAAREAIEGPDAIIDLAELGADRRLDQVLGNEDAGRLFQALYSKHRDSLTSSTSFSQRLQETQNRLPVAPVQADAPMWDRLKELAPDMAQSGWLWELLRDACKLWMDTRFRALRDHTSNTIGANTTGYVPIPPASIRYFPDGMSPRSAMITGFIHGGDLRFDALMCHLSFGEARHQRRRFDRYMRGLYTYYYGMDAEVGIWLCKSSVSIVPIPP